MIQCSRKECSEYGKCTILFDCPLFRPLVKPKETDNKYHAEKCAVDGIMFDSRKEAKRYAELLLLSRTGQITGLRRQVPYELIPVQKDARGKVIFRATKYYADFVYTLPNGETVVEDTKGMRTELYKVKKKLMYARYKILIKEI